MSEVADLRIASRRAFYDNGKPYGQSETITLYIYNGGPDRAVAPVVKAGYSGSMDYDAVRTTLRQAQEWHQPSRDIKNGSLIWRDLPDLASRVEGWDMVTELPDVPPGILMELNLLFPMLEDLFSRDRTLNASVFSSTVDPRTYNNSTTYTITPNHHDDGPDYWNTPGNLANLDFDGLASVLPLSRADLRIASSKAHYNNNLPFGQSETLTFLVFNDGPTTSIKPRLKVGFTISMDYDKASCTCEQVWIPDGVNPSLNIDNHDWKDLPGISWRIDEFDIICSLPNIPPSLLYRVKINFPMTHDTSFDDYYGTATISSESVELNQENNSTGYVITPNHDDDGDEYWQAKGNIAQLNGPSNPSGSRRCSAGWEVDTPAIVLTLPLEPDQIPVGELAGYILGNKTQVISYNIGRKSLDPKSTTVVEYGNSIDVFRLSFSIDGKSQLTYGVHPDTLLYLDPTTIPAGKDQLRLGYWVPVRALWVGAVIRGADRLGNLRPAYVTNIQYSRVSDSRSAVPRVVSQSHSYLIGTLAAGSVLTHNGPGDELCGDAANVPAILANLARIAEGLVATEIPAPNFPDPPHGYSLRRRRPTDPPPTSIHAPPVLPADVPRRDDEGNWLIYLYEEDTLGAVENARYAVEQIGLPWSLTYDPYGVHARRSQSTGQYQSQRELLQLSREELAGGVGIGQLDRDEYPPAIAAEGGAGAVVTYIEAGDNRRAGSLMGRQFASYREDPQPDGHPPLRPGDRFRYAIIHANMAGVEYLGDATDGTQLEKPPID
ncbi:nuclease [Annulohypoxylon moriforme]|nr:nuclease [Annulohypoxylon moriforme]